MIKLIGGACAILSVIGIAYSDRFDYPSCDRITFICAILGVLGTVLVLL